MAFTGTKSGPGPAAATQSPDPFLIRIRDLIYQVAGIFHPDSKLYFLQDRCKRRMTARDLSSIQEYLDALTIKADRERELQLLLNEITVGETSFFRNQPQLDALRKFILPELLREKERLGYQRLRIWSAGCSTGEEPYTLAMILLEEMQARHANWQIEVFATDINEKSLAKARQGQYAAYALRNVSRPLLEKYFTPAGDGQFLVREEPRALVSFQHLNLFDERRLMFLRGLDLILCCNVLIYFDAESKRRMIQHFYNMLQPHGYLFLGHAESLFGINDDFRLVHYPGATAYARSRRSLS